MFVHQVSKKKKHYVNVIPMHKFAVCIHLLVCTWLFSAC